MVIKKITAKQEAMIVSALQECPNTFEYILEELFTKKAYVFVEHLVLSLRELGYYIENYFNENLNGQQRKQIDKIKDIRDAICHRSSPKNLLHPHMHISGGFNYKDDDIEIQYGQTRMFLLKEMFQLYLDFREIFSSSQHMGFWARHPSWNIEKRKLSQLSMDFRESLKVDNVMQEIKKEMPQ